jgi:hypothetical protein
VELYRAGSLLSGWGTLECGGVDVPLTLTPGLVYQFKLSPLAGEGLHLILYSLTVENLP